MLFTGTELTQKRNYYTQTGNYGFVMSATVDTTTGAYHFGLSGNAGTLDFRLESGKMYWGNEFIHSYKAYEEFTVEAQFSSGHANVLKNNSSLVYGLPKATGYFDYFYFTRASANMGAEFDVNISGNNAAVYSITTQGYLYSTGQNAVTGWLSNQGGFPLRVFNSEEQSSVIYDFGKLVGNVGAGSSGSFAFTGDYNTLDFSEPILTTFATNYGDTEILFSIIDTRSFDSFVQLTAPTNFTFNSSNVLNRDVSYLNFSGGAVSDGFNTELTFVLGYVSGSGRYHTQTGYTVAGYGNFQLSGLVTGLLNVQTGSHPVTGSAYATGAATGFFSGMGTGMVSGLGYTGLGTGYMTGLATGFILAGSGILGLISPLIGSGISAIGTSLTGAVYATGYTDISSLIDGDSFQIIRPNGTDYTTSPTAKITCGYAPIDPANCNTTNPQAATTDFPTASDLISCISGFTALGLNGVVTAPNIISWTSTIIGTSGNGVLFSGSDITLPGSGFTTGGHNGFGYSGVATSMGQPYTGAFPITITGSGSYISNITGLYNVYYDKTFTGSWMLSTGSSASNLWNFTAISDTLYSGNGTFAPNSYVNLQVTYTPSGTTPDGAYLFITGTKVINGINQRLSMPV